MRHFLEELEDLQKKLLEMGGVVEFAIRRSVNSLVDRDEAAAQDVLRSEARINQMEIEIDDFAVRLLALHQPMARDLRFLTGRSRSTATWSAWGTLPSTLWSGRFR